MTGYDWDFQFLLPYAGAFVRAAVVTVWLSISSFALGTIAGVGGGAALYFMPRWLSKACLLANDMIRAVPMLVLLFFVYFFPAPQLLGLPALGPASASIIALAIAQAAYTTDLVRSALQQVPLGSVHAARAIGLRSPDVWRFVILPDVIRQIAPAQIAFFIGIIRLSSLASIIGCREVVFVARVAASQNFRALEAWIVVALIYVILVLPLTVTLRRFERRLYRERT